ncbi:MAG: LysR family transcriptional regulator [Clostridiales bacterium]|nr:LysR family transcriptional regulator [Clostridiales bacterium]
MLYEKLNYILTIAEEQNLTRAAKRLFISQPTLTLYLNRLEAELGVKLFDRSHTPVTLTEAGAYYVEEMKKISSSEQYLYSNIRLIANPNQTLSIGIGQVRGHHWLPMILPTFCSIHPDVSIQVIQGAENYMSEALQNRQIDLVFGVLPASVSNLETEDLMYEKMYLIAHRKYGLIPQDLRSETSAEHPYTLQPEALNGLPFIIPQVSNGLYNSYESLIMKNGISPSRTISVSNLNTGLQLAVAGLGVQLLSGSILQMGTNASAMECLDFCTIDGMPDTRKCVAAYNRDNKKKHLIRDVIRIVRQEVLVNCEFIQVVSSDKVLKD